MPSNNNWLDPAIVVVCLLIAQLVQLVFGQRLSFADEDLALFAFIVSGPLLHRSDRSRLVPGQTASARLRAGCVRVLVRWGAIVAALLFLIYAFDMRGDLNRGVILTWFVITPIALCLSQAVRLRTR